MRRSHVWTGQPKFHLAQRDAVAWLRELDAESVDLVITDPPYESLEKHRAVGTTTRLKHSKASSNDWFSIFPNTRFPELFEQVYRVLRKSSHFYLYCDPETMFVAKPLAEKAGFKFWKPLVWDKCTIGMGYHYRARYECVLFFEKGKRKLADLGIADIIEHKRVVGGYPAEKPPEVSEVLIQQSTTRGDLVIDPFMRIGLGRGRGDPARARVRGQRPVRRGGRDLARALARRRRGRGARTGCDDRRAAGSAGPRGVSGR